MGRVRGAGRGSRADADGLELLDGAFDRLAHTVDVRRPASHRSPGRYGIDAVVHEFNCNWIEGLKDYPSARHWTAYGAALADVFDAYFREVRP